MLYNNLIEPSEVFVSDGAKCDIMRIQQVFGPKVVSAVQDPSYPVYVDTSVMVRLLFAPMLAWLVSMTKLIKTASLVGTNWKPKQGNHAI